MLSRRSFLALLAAPLGAWLLAACGGGGDEVAPAAPAEPPAAPPASGTEAIAIADVERVAAAPGDAAPAVHSIGALGADLYAALVEGNEDNVVFSPASILLALAMARAGAAGTTASEMDAVLHLDDPDGIHHALNGLTRALEAHSGTVEVNGEPAELELSIANAVWGQETIQYVHLALRHVQDVAIIKSDRAPAVARRGCRGSQRGRN